ncbi:MAG TPA: aldo/keto reductase [Chthonomonadaceae bacterium]|nr:aldo/keto reductase [Chthonomonadaceae bacterium]
MPATLQPARSLGATGVSVPLIGYGTAPLGKKEVSREDAVRCLNAAIDRGITYLDTSPDYGSEPHIGEVMRTRRNEVFLATKVNKRSRDGALDDLHQSLEKLQTDHVDLIQLHAVNTWADLEQVLAPDGALAGLEQARQEGLVRFIGITGHARPEILADALTRYRFDTVLCALGMADHLVSAPDIFLLPQAIESKAGVIAMKVLGHGHFPDAELALRYSLGLPGVSLAIVGMASPQEIDQIVSIAATYRPLEEHEEARLIEQVRPLIEQDAQASQKGQGDLFWLHDTTVMGWQKKDEPVLVAY